MAFPRLIPPLAFVAALIVATVTALSAQAADRARLEAFLNVTGFDIALESIKLSAASAPEMLGLDTDLGTIFD